MVVVVVLVRDRDGIISQQWTTPTTALQRDKLLQRAGDTAFTAAERVTASQQIGLEVQESPDLQASAEDGDTG
ncbi:hypothetical protein Hamer_G028984 [Homarus americanus]|uniref:Uncharacterized protein n=1 Tax=Homarus americanus TaxID=6706 RepID=A0A8J5JNT9_HOMAM|nr:hypothetical protein Hamer_G028984 [Homarus americanus]